jgi:hypothetical protein
MMANGNDMLKADWPDWAQAWFPRVAAILSLLAVVGGIVVATGSCANWVAILVSVLGTASTWMALQVKSSAQRSNGVK